MKSSLTNRDRIIMMVGGSILLGYMSMISTGIDPIKPDGEVQRVFERVVDILGYIVKNFTFPVISFIILWYAWELSRKNRINKWGFYVGLGLCIWAITMHRIGLIPTSIASSTVYSLKILIYSIISVLIGFSFLYLLNVVADRPVSGLLVALMTGTSLTCFYFYYFSESLQLYLLPIAPAVFVGGGFYEMISKKEDEEKRERRSEGSKS